nr:hypothetical protein [Tanacetum cinerariifolium]
MRLVVTVGPLFLLANGAYTWNGKVDISFFKRGARVIFSLHHPLNPQLINKTTTITITNPHANPQAN